MRESYGKILLLIGMFIFGFIVALFVVKMGYFSFLATDHQVLDRCLPILKPAIDDAGKFKIDTLVNQTSYLGNNPERLNLIAKLTTDDFSDYYWNSTKYEYSFLGSNSRYAINKYGRIYQRDKGSLDLTRDPYWIAFQKTGQCQALSILFNQTANDSGFETQIVRSDNLDHFWNEVYLDGEWKFFDVQQYGYVQGRGSSSQWFGNRSDFVKIYPSLCENLQKGNHNGVYIYNLTNDGYIEPSLTNYYCVKN